MILWIIWQKLGWTQVKMDKKGPSVMTSLRGSEKWGRELELDPALPDREIVEWFLQPWGASWWTQTPHHRTWALQTMWPLEKSTVHQFERWFIACDNNALSKYWKTEIWNYVIESNLSILVILPDCDLACLASKIVWNEKLVKFRSCPESILLQRSIKIRVYHLDNNSCFH